MASDDASPPLLSRLARLILPHSSPKGGLPNVPGYSTKALKAMMERKRKNDSIRKQEFDRLRKLRQQNPSVVAEGMHMSLFPNSTPMESDGRAITLKKINEIEAQMSKLWRKPKLPAALAQPNTPPRLSPPAAPVLPKVAPLHIAAPIQQPVTQAEPLSSQYTQFAPASDSRMPAAHGSPPPPHPTHTRTHLPSHLSTHFPTHLGIPTCAHPSVHVSTHLSPQAIPPSLLEAEESTHQGLPDTTHLAPLSIHSSLHSSEAPSYQYPSLIGNTLQPALTEGASSGPTAKQQAAAPTLYSEMLREDQPIADTGFWNTPTDGADLFAAEMDVVATDAELEEAAIRFANGDVAGAQDCLREALQGPDLQPESALAWSAALLDLYRATQQQAAFEAAAQEFAWLLDGSAPTWDRTSPQQPGSDPLLYPANAPWVLHGHVLGDAVRSLTQAQPPAPSPAHARCIVDCAALIRVDFSAAGSLLNWVIAQEARGIAIQFDQVHRLVAAFFNVIGIHEHAKVVLRPL